ncbi:MAG: putative bifunctional diguanylate cyclase/phosphodiesterase, partial [Steroidobacteraceae bacterium]
MRQAIEENRPFATAFVDMRMPPGWDGLETIEHLWRVDPNLQVVICSAHSDYDWIELTSRLGHADKLLIVKKPFETIEILQCASALTRKWQNELALRLQVETLEQAIAARTQGLEVANKQLRHLATHDSLTGLPNRTLLEDRLSQAIAQAERQGSAFGVIVVDLDRFKLVNDSLGHRAGDDLLKEIAHRLTNAVRNADTVARMGGDEFVLIVGLASDQDDITGLARHISETLQLPINIAGVEIRITPSVGIAFYPSDATCIESLIARADAAMYAAKQHGRNNIRYYAPGMDAVTREKVRLESDLHYALERHQFELHYQPKVDTDTGLVRSAEVLLRWHHPELGWVPPSEFIPIAEECGLIGAIGEWVLRQACRQAGEWQRAGMAPLRVAVNLSATQFRQGNLLEVIGGALKDADLDPRYVEIELTESAIMTNPGEAIMILERLSSMGVLVSVDDFGTGYSSMSYLRRFPIDKLKIDRSFV